ncbi:MAG: hypothetical protein IB618_00695 [Candidatus Pacearchaeota archaeon]|nr:MAG: hypothetical protein IB618_00695 [Candidatus Pacearchaeota archaeon]
MIDESLCIRCKGRGWCGGPCKILARLREFQPKISKEFSGSSPPEIFVGRYGYPNVFTGILAPTEFGETEELSMPEVWHEQGAGIQDILAYRSRMIYSRFISSIKSARSKQQSRLLDLMQEISLASKPVDASFKLKKKPRVRIQMDAHVPMIGNPAPLKSVKLESNPKVEKKVDYLTSDTDVKSTQAIKELYKSKIPVSNIIKILSGGMLGLRIQRRLVPTRWAVSAIDDTISKTLLEKIRHYQEISSYLLFHASYLGNYYNIILIPNCWSFEVIEASAKGYFGRNYRIATWQDYEFFQKRKKYAFSVTGAYYANRLAVCEYLYKTKRQASVLVLREIRDEYWAPCGVGILREVTREAMQSKPEKFDTLKGALSTAQTKFKLPLEIYTTKSKLLQNIKTQTRLSKFLS